MAGRRSTIDDHPDRARIELMLARGVTLRVIAKRFGVSRDAAHRHKKRMPPQLRAALAAKALRPGVDLEKLRIEESEGLLQHLMAARGRLYKLLDDAEELADIKAATSVHAQLRGNIETTGKLLGEFAVHATRITNNLLVAPEYLSLRAALVQALRPFPDARRAVAAVLQQVEREAVKRPAPVLEGRVRPIDESRPDDERSAA